MNSGDIILILSSVGNYIIAIFVFFKYNSRRSNIFFGIFNFLLASWTLSNFFIDYLEKYESIYFFTVATAVINSFLPFIFVLFVLTFPKNSKYTRTYFFLIAPFAILFFLTSFTKHIVSGVNVTTYPVSVEHGSLFLPFAAYIALNLLLGIGILLKRFFSEKNIAKKQLGYLFFGASLMIVISVITNIAIPLINESSALTRVGPASSLLFGVATFYAIARYRLLNIKIVITRSLIYLLLVAIISISFIAISSYLASFIEIFSLNRFAVWVIFSAIIVFGIGPLKNLFALLTDRIFFKDKIDYRQELKSLSNLINEEIDLQSLIINFTKEFNVRLKVKNTDIYLLLKNYKSFVSLTSYTKIDQRHGPIKQLKTNSQLIKYLRKFKKNILVTDELESYIYDLPDSSEKNHLYNILEQLRAGNIFVAVPLVRDDKLIGILSIDKKSSGESFSTDDISLFEVMGVQLAAALERSRLYEEVQDFNAKLQKEVEKATKNLQRANEQLKEANVHLKELDSAKSEFMSIASHQLRTPLAGIVGYLSMILEGDYGKIDTSQQKIVSEVFAASQRLVRLVNTFLNVTRIEAGRFTLAFSEVNFVDLVRGEVMELQPTADKKNVTLVYEEPKDKNITAMVDDKIKDAVLNLIDNAIKYTPEGTVTVQLKKEDKDTLLFSVKDSGVGISKGEAGNLFQKFVRGSGIAKVQPNGSGLGLYIVKKIVEGHGGKVWAESEGEGKGSTFNIRIPIKQKKSEYRAKAEQIFTGRTGAAE